MLENTEQGPVNHLRVALEQKQFFCTAELVLGRDHNVKEAETFVNDAAAEPAGIKVISVTDLPGGNPALPPEAFVAGQSQDVFHAHARQSMQATFQGGTISVLAGEVRNRRQAFFPDGRDEGLRRQRGIAARQVRHADHLDAVGLGGGIFQESFGFRNVMVAAQN